MRIFAVADLHLSFAEKFDPAHISNVQSNKAMDIFGPAWDNHIPGLYSAWQDLVSEKDIVLVPGDISWAMTLNDAEYDFDFLRQLKGTKVLLRGNHDYWWQSLSKIRKVLPSDILVLQNDAVNLEIGDCSLCGTRFWISPFNGDFKTKDKKVYDRKLIRQEISLKAAAGKYIINMNHFPPMDDDCNPNELTDLLESYGVKDSVYGHLHGKLKGAVPEGQHRGINYHCVSCDYLDFKPKLIAEF